MFPYELTLFRIQHIIDEVHGEANVLDTPHQKSLDEKFATIVDVNDRVLDRIVGPFIHEVIFIDTRFGPRRKS